MSDEAHMARALALAAAAGGAGEAPVGCVVVDGAGQAKVGDGDPLGPGIQQDIGRLDVAVDQTLGMRRGQTGRDLSSDS